MKPDIYFFKTLDLASTCSFYLSLSLSSNHTSGPPRPANTTRSLLGTSPCNADA